MSIPHDTRLAIGREGIRTVENLSEMTDEDLKLVVDNLRKPSVWISDPRAGVRGAGIPARTTIPTPAYAFSARSLLRLKAASRTALYYEKIGRDINPDMMVWRTVIKTFCQHQGSLEKRAKKNKPMVPKLTKEVPVTE